MLMRTARLMQQRQLAATPKLTLAASAAVNMQQQSTVELLSPCKV
jgi:hypothetical protein